jgi:hypothetical protein
MEAWTEYKRSGKAGTPTMRKTERYSDTLKQHGNGLAENCPNLPLARTHRRLFLAILEDWLKPFWKIG